MARMTWAEGQKIAEKAAWENHGRKHATLYIYGRFAGPAAAVGLVALAGYGAHWVWTSAADTLSRAGQPGGADVPTWMVVAALVLFVATIAGVRGRGSDHPRRFSTVVVTAVVLAAAWLFLIALAIGSIA